MAGLREFVVRFGTEEQCIEHLAGLRWPGGFACAGCGGGQAWRLKTRPRVYECASCHRQESATAGTVFHRTRTDLTKWFLAAYLMGRDKRGVSAKFLQRELDVAYQTAWTMAHKLRHGLSEDRSRPLHGFLEADETFIGGRDDPTSPGRSTANPDKSLVVAAVEKVPAPKNRCAKHGHAVKRQHGFFAGAPSSTAIEVIIAVPINTRLEICLIGFSRDWSRHEPPGTAQLYSKPQCRNLTTPEQPSLRFSSNIIFVSADCAPWINGNSRWSRPSARRVGHPD